MSAELQMRTLFNVYYEQCPHERIRYTASEFRDNHLQSWIVMNGIELCYMMYQGKHQYIFMCNRYCPKLGDETYYFKTYEECSKVLNMAEEELIEYAYSL